MLGREPREREHASSTAWTWLTAGSFDFGLKIYVDQLAVFMMLIVSGVGSLIVAYSIGYMDGDDEERRYFAYMALFVFSMLLLVEAGNLLILLAGWGLVGLSLVPADRLRARAAGAVAAAKKAFIMNAFGDATMALALFLLIQQTGTLELPGGVRRGRAATSAAAARSSTWSRSACSAARSRSRRRCRCRPGCPTRWRARRRSAP